MERFADGLIQALQKCGDAFFVTAHECGEQSLVVYSDGRAFYRRHSPQHDVASGTGEQRCDMWPAIFRIGRRQVSSPAGNQAAWRTGSGDDNTTFQGKSSSMRLIG